MGKVIIKCLSFVNLAQILAPYAKFETFKICKISYTMVKW